VDGGIYASLGAAERIQAWRVFYYFGPSAAVGGSNFDEGFGVELNSMRSSVFKMSARELAARPDDLLSEHEEQLNRTLGQSAAIFLAEETEAKRVGC
jgi:hypothetical protein